MGIAKQLASKHIGLPVDTRSVEHDLRGIIVYYSRQIAQHYTLSNCERKRLPRAFLTQILEVSATECGNHHSFDGMHAVFGFIEHN